MNQTQTAETPLLTGKAKNWALAGLFLSMFVSMIAMNVVGTSMPVIMGDIGGTQATFTWVVMATTLTSAISTPIWGKLADLTSKKVLVQTALVIFMAGSILSGLAHDPSWLIACRALQGIGVGGLGALNQIVLAEIVSPRERGKYMGIMGAIMAVATVGGPLVGGLLTETIGWRWNFYVAVPFAIAAIIMLQLTLHLPTARGKVNIDYLGAALISAGFSSLLIWITLGGSEFEWASWQTALMVGAAVVMLGIAVVVELKAKEPLIPLALFKNPTFTLAVIASIPVGVALMTSIVYLSQYMQLARDRTVIESSLLTLPMMAGVLGASTVVGNLITRTGKWKGFMVAGAVALAGGMLLMGQLRYDTPLWFVDIAMFILGCGIGMTMQNLVLVVQNTVEPHQMGAASSAVTFFRTLGGSAGMAVMGTMLAHNLANYLKDGMTELAATLAKTDPAKLAEIQDGAKALEGGAIPKVADLPEVIRPVFESAMGHAVGDVFLSVVPIAIVALITIVFLPNLPLSTLSNAERMAKRNTGNAEPSLGAAIEQEGVAFMAATTGTGTIQVVPESDAQSPQDEQGSR